MVTMQHPTLDRVEIPGLSEEERDAAERMQGLLAEADDHAAHIRRQQVLMARAMFRLGKPIFRGGKPKRRKPNKVRRYAETMRTRSAYRAAAISGIEAE